MPVYLPTAKSHRTEINGLSESDTDGPPPRTTRTTPSKPSRPSTATAPKLKETTSFSLWPFSRSKSSQKLPHHTPVAATTTKVRADSTPSQPRPTTTTTERPEHRRYASDNTIGTKAERTLRPAQPPITGTTTQPTHSRTMAFATDASRPQAPPAQPLPTRASYDGPLPSARPTATFPSTNTAVPIQRPETPSQAPIKPLLPPLYAPNTAARPGAGTGAAPKGYEARAADSAPRIERKPSLSRIYAPPQPTRTHPAPEVWVPPANIYATPSQPPPQTMPAILSGRVGPPAEVKAPGPDALHSQLRELLSDKPPAPLNRAEDRAPIYRPAAPISRPAETQPPPVQLFAVPTAPKSVSRTDKAGESSRKSKKTQPEAVEPAPRASSSRTKDKEEGRSSRSKKEPVITAVMKTPSRDSAKATKEHSPPVTKTSSRDPQQPIVAVMKTPSKESSRQTPSPVMHSTPPRAGERPPSRTQHAPSAERSSRKEPAPPFAPVPVFSERTRSVQPPLVASIPSEGPPIARPASRAEGRPASRAEGRPPSRVERPPSRADFPIRPPSRMEGPMSSQPPRPPNTTQPVASSSRPPPVQRMPSEESILRTPSSLAHSVLHPTVSRTSVSSETRKKGLLDMFRSKPERSWDATDRARSPARRDPGVHSADEASYRRHMARQQAPPPIKIPKPGAGAVPPDRKSPNSRVFTPFRILSNKRRRRVSTASMDAVNGTAPNTVMGSPTASMQSTIPAQLPPPTRDPMTATQDWRNHEESKVEARGKKRRLRPGVVFDVPHDETGMEENKPKRTTSATDPKADALKQYQDSDGHFSLVRNFRLADLVTIMNGVCGSFSIFSSAHYLVSHDTDYLWSALWFPVAGLMFDFFDGKVARWRKSSSLLGQELDSLADLISFGVAPALLAFVVGLRTYLDTVLLTTFICCGLARLARFNATVALVPKDEAGKAKYFEGLPIPSSLALSVLSRGNGLLSEKLCKMLWKKSQEIVLSVEPDLALPDDEDWDTFLKNLNEALNPLNLQMRSMPDETTGRFVFSMVNCDEQGIILAPRAAYSISSLAALREVSALKPKSNMSKTQAEIVLSSFVANGWLLRSRRGRYSLSPRSLLELDRYINSTYGKDILHECSYCLGMTTKGYACKGPNCNIHIHAPCFTRYMARGKHCPNSDCQIDWPNDGAEMTPIGEAAVREGDDAKRRVRRADDASEDEEEEAVESDELEETQDPAMDVDDKDDDEDSDTPVKKPTRGSRKK
nr:phosphatidylserine synthase [Mycena chlorophos]